MLIVAGVIKFKRTSTKWHSRKFTPCGVYMYPTKISSNLPYMADSQKLLSLHVVPIIHNSSQNHVNVMFITELLSLSYMYATPTFLKPLPKYGV